MRLHHWPRTVLSFLVLAAATATSAVTAEAQTPNGDDARRGASIELYGGETLGTYHWPISTQVPRAQAYFDQGVRLMFAYTPPDARFSFQEARREDPSCAMCWWGEAWSMGPTFNGGMAASSAPGAYEAAQRARSLAPRATPVERALIEALAVRYAPTHPERGRGGLDSAYAAAMAQAYDRFPESDEVGTLYADALMLLEPRRGTSGRAEADGLGIITTVLDIYINGSRVISDEPAPGEIFGTAPGKFFFLRQVPSGREWTVVEYGWTSQHISRTSRTDGV